MADGTIINENDRTGVLDIEGEIARASAQVTELDGKGQDKDADNEASGPEAMSQSIESFTKPGSAAGPAMGLTSKKPQTFGPFILVNPAPVRPFTLMSPTTNLAREFKNRGPAMGGPKPGSGKKKGKDRSKLDVVNAYGGGLREISGANMPSPAQLKTMMLDPQLLEALQNEKRKMDDPNIVEGADRLNAQDYLRLKESPEHLEGANHRNATAQVLTNKPPRM